MPRVFVIVLSTTAALVTTASAPARAAHPVAPAAHATATPAAPGRSAAHAAAPAAPRRPAAHAVATPAAGGPPGRDGVCSQAYLPLPDPACQPGAVNPDVTQATIGVTICVAGWTRTVRPPVSYTNALKRRQIAEYGYTDTNPADYEEDHLIPLELGGAPRDPRNLWPEPRYDAGGGTAAGKDEVENALKRKVCAGLMPLAAARTIMAVDWRRGRNAAASR
ncbi:hypothetical protein NE235_33370 [Actinoallomurus spadix]|uniref:HNH endonuclease n=1 Tax=Actinoallomurus spadix TaxID=79912 RepID=A0ABN0X897_9ACTN|nr:hypothetical protein [Actinoallomurus spadix]MCO5991013.1 hypothetical protein [Actinoallomurus spadix]